MKNHTYIVLLALVFLLLSCGVKKHAAETSAVAAEPVVETAPTDTLPDFLKEFANDSTIHINWAYGIPFIIDDSVPMLLPPIDKNPEGYVSSDNYSLCHFTNPYPAIYYGRNRGQNISICRITNPIDSILWLNKCIDDLRSYGSAYNKEFTPNHLYEYYIRSIQELSTGNELVQIVVKQIPYFLYWHEKYPHRFQSTIFYFYDCSGNLLGKMYETIPTEWLPAGREPIPLRTNIIDYQAFRNRYLLDVTENIIMNIVLRLIFPGSDYIVGD